MATIQHKDLNAEIQFRAIELLNCSLNLPSDPNTPANFNFNIQIENRTDATNKLVFAVVHVEVKKENDAVLLGTLSVSCIFEILNFEEVIQVETDGNVTIPPQLLEILSSLSISTTRGVMFSTFKGTYLHSVVLPIIDPKQLQMVQQK